MSAGDASIRVARARDRGAVLGLWAALLHDHPSLTSRIRVDRAEREELWQRQLASVFDRDWEDPEAGLWVATEPAASGSPRSETLLGFCIARRLPSPPALSEPPRGSLDELYVIPAARRRGLGGELVDGALRALRQRGVSRVEIRVLEDNPLGLAFWRAQGFATTARILECALGDL